LSRDGKIEGQRASFTLNQVYQATEHYVLMEVEIDKAIAEPGRTDAMELGTVHVAYTAPEGGAQRTLDAGIHGTFSASADAVAASRDARVLEAAVEQSTRARTVKAIGLRDQGKAEEAQALFKENVAEIEAYTARAGRASDRMQQLKNEYGAIASAPVAAAPAAWNQQRKLLRQLDAAQPGSGVRY
jgi:hypothetical protein